MSGAPVGISEEEKQRYHIQTVMDTPMEEDTDYKDEAKTVNQPVAT